MRTGLTRFRWGCPHRLADAGASVEILYRHGQARPGEFGPVKWISTAAVMPPMSPLRSTFISIIGSTGAQAGTQSGGQPGPTTFPPAHTCGHASVTEAPCFYHHAL